VPEVTVVRDVMVAVLPDTEQDTFTGSGWFLAVSLCKRESYKWLPA
jgi:hypothetical protein